MQSSFQLSEALLSPGFDKIHAVPECHLFFVSLCIAKNIFELMESLK